MAGEVAPLGGVRHVVRTGPVGWTFAIGSALFGAVSAGGVVEARGHPLWVLAALAFSVWALARAAVGGVWVDRGGGLVVRDWVRTRRYRVDEDLAIGYIPYDGWGIFNGPRSRVWATLTFSDGGRRPRACRMTVATFEVTKKRVNDLREGFGLPNGPARLE